LRSCAYYEVFEKPKLFYQVIQFHPLYCYDDKGHFGNDKTFFLPSSDLYLLAVLNSPLMWWYNWRFLGHMKDEALNPAAVKMVSLSIARPTTEIRAEAESLAQRLISISKMPRETVSEAVEQEKVQLELGLSSLVNKAYGLTPDEERLLWRTAPPRMPIKPIDM
jgi:hypothetical protein